MNKINIYVLFGTTQSISNYTKSIDYLLKDTSSTDYLVAKYENLNHKDALNFKENLNGYKNFLFIPFEDYEILHQKLYLEARSFMKK